MQFSRFREYTKRWLDVVSLLFLKTRNWMIFPTYSTEMDSRSRYSPSCFHSSTLEIIFMWITFSLQMHLLWQNCVMLGSANLE